MARRTDRIEAARLLWMTGVPQRWIEIDLGIGAVTLTAHMPDRPRPQSDNHGDKVLDHLVWLAAQGLLASSHSNRE